MERSTLGVTIRMRGGTHSMWRHKPGLLSELVPLAFSQLHVTFIWTATHSFAGWASPWCSGNPEIFKIWKNIQCRQKNPEARIQRKNPEAIEKKCSGKENTLNFAQTYLLSGGSRHCKWKFRGQLSHLAILPEAPPHIQQLSPPAAWKQICRSFDECIRKYDALS